MTMKPVYSIDGEVVDKGEFDALQAEYKKVKSKYNNKVPTLTAEHSDFLPSSSYTFVDDGVKDKPDEQDLNP